MIERNITNIIAASCTLIVAAVLASLVMMVNTREAQAQTAQEIRDLTIMQHTNAARIQALADEQGWVRESVKIQVEVMK